MRSRSQGSAYLVHWQCLFLQQMAYDSKAVTDTMCPQAHVCQVGLSSVLAALNNHPIDTDIQAKGLVVLGVLGQVRSRCICLPAHCAMQ